MVRESAAGGFRLALAEYVMSQARPIEKLGHQPRLYALTRLVGRGHAYDDDVVFAAVWLHDLGVFEGHRPEDPRLLSGWDHTGYAMRHAPAALARAGFPAEKVASVVEAIRTHQPQDEPGTIEGIILRDADILEQLGSIGILRVAAKVGRDTRYRIFTDAVATLRRSLQELPDRLRLESAKALAEPRIALLRDFLRQIDEETQGNPY